MSTLRSPQKVNIAAQAAMARVAAIPACANHPDASTGHPPRLTRTPKFATVNTPSQTYGARRRGRTSALNKRRSFLVMSTVTSMIEATCSDLAS